MSSRIARLHYDPRPLGDMLAATAVGGGAIPRRVKRTAGGKAAKGDAARERGTKAFAPSVGPSRVAELEAGGAFFRAADRRATRA
jgi:hypothetical protein